MGIASEHATGRSLDDSIALVTSVIGAANTAMLREQVAPILADGSRAVAVIEMLAVMAAGFAEAGALAAGMDVNEWLSRIALRDQLNRPVQR